MRTNDRFGLDVLRAERTGDAVVGLRATVIAIQGEGDERKDGRGDDRKDRVEHCVAPATPGGERDDHGEAEPQRGQRKENLLLTTHISHSSPDAGHPTGSCSWPPPQLIGSNAVRPRAMS